MEEPKVIEVSTPLKKESKGQDAARKTKKATKKKMSFIAMSYLIVLIGFVIGIVICSIGSGANSLDYQITMFFYITLGGGIAGTGPWHSFGMFFDPDAYSASAWQNLDIGQIFWFILVIIVIIFLIASLIPYFSERKKAKQENRIVNYPDNVKYLKYALLIGLVAAGITLGLTDLIKWLVGRARPYTLASPADFIPWYLNQGGPRSSDAFASFWSGHTSSGVFTVGLALAFAGSKRKWLAVLFGILTTLYAVCMGLSRMVLGAHYFSDVLWGGFVTYSFLILFYYGLLDIPGQENIYRYELTYRPFNEGLKSILDGREHLEDNQDEALAKVSSGLEKLALARTNAERITKNGHDFSQFISRIDDLVARIGTLMQEKPIDATKWTYFC